MGDTLFTVMPRLPGAFRALTDACQATSTINSRMIAGGFPTGIRIGLQQRLVDLTG